MGLRTGPQTAPGSPPTAAGSSSVLQTDLDTMASASQFVRDSADTIYSQLMTLHQTVDDLSQTWNSQTATLFCNNVFSDWGTRASTLHTNLYTIADGLQNSHQSYNQMEEENMRAVVNAAAQTSAQVSNP